MSPLLVYYLPSNYYNSTGYYSNAYETIYYDGYGYNFYYGDYGYYEYSVNDEAPETYRGLDRFDARKQIVADLEALGLVEKIEPHK